MDWQGLLETLAASPIVEALRIFGSALVLAWLTKFLLVRVVRRLTAKTRTDLDDAILGYLENPVFVSLVLIGAHLALVILDVPAPWDRYSLALFMTLAIVVWLIFLVRVVNLVLKAMARHRERFNLIQPQTVPSLSSLFNALLVGGAVYFLLLAWKINISAWVASAGIVGLAVSLAARDTLANMFAGLAILADRPYKLGDYIVLETGERGEVAQMGLRSSRLLTRDDIEIIVPNSVMANSKIINEAGGPAAHHRVRVKVSVAYGSDIDQVREVLLEVAAADEAILPEPEPRVRFRRFGDSGLEIELLGWVPEPWMRGRVLDALNTAVYKRFGAEGIEIPFPRRHVILEHVDKRDDPEGEG